MGRKASISTQQVMAALPSSDYSNHPILQRILQMFQNPTQHTDYLNSQQFAKDLFKLCQKIRHSLEKEPRVVFLQSVSISFKTIPIVGGIVGDHIIDFLAHSSLNVLLYLSLFSHVTFSVTFMVTWKICISFPIISGAWACR